MKNLILISFGFFILSLSNVAIAQSKYKKFDESNGVIFYYKWKPSKFLKKDSPLALLLKVENTNDNDVNTSFVVDYFWETLRKASSPELSFCIKPGKKKKGKMNKLGFDIGTFSREDIKSDKFIVEVSGVKVKKATSCN